MQASMPTRHGGRLASRASTWPRDHFCRSTIAPRRSCPTTWNEFLPISMPTTAIALVDFWDMACSFSAPRTSFDNWRGWSTAGPSHYRTLRDVAHASLVQCGRIDTDRSGYFPVVLDEGGLVLTELEPALSLWHFVREMRKNKYA